MRTGDRRLLFWAALAAIVLSLLFGWWAGLFAERTPESRVRDAADDIRERVRELTH